MTTAVTVAAAASAAYTGVVTDRLAAFAEEIDLAESDIVPYQDPPELVVMLQPPAARLTVGDANSHRDPDRPQHKAPVRAIHLTGLEWGA